MRTAIAHRDTESLRRPDGDVSSELARRLEQRQRQRIGRHHRNGASSPQPRDRLAKIADLAERAWILEQGAENRRGIDVAHGVAGDHLPAQRFCPGLQHGKSLGMAIAVGEKDGSPRLRNPLRHGHRFGGRRRFVEERSIGNVQCSQIRDHGLEIQQGLEPPLADFGLIRRVRGVPSRIFQNIALDHGRQDRAVISLADQRGQDDVVSGELACLRERLDFRQRRSKIERAALANVIRNGLGDQFVEARDADRLQHRAHVVRPRSDMAALEIVGDRWIIRHCRALPKRSGSSCRTRRYRSGCDRPARPSAPRPASGRRSSS